MKSILLFFLLINLNLVSQNSHNKLLGKFTNSKTSSLYTSFEFDNNGKVTIDQLSNSDFFIIGDTIIVFPDKDLFKFILKKDGIYGASEWVKDGVWTKTAELVIDNRKNEQLANLNAQLLNEYYQKTRVSINQLDLLFDKDLKNTYKSNIEDLCNRNLVRACKEYFGILTLEQMGGFEAALNGKEKSNIAPNKNFQNVIDKVSTIDTAEGKYLNALYLSMIGQPEASEKILQELADSKHPEAALMLMQLAMKKIETSEISIKEKLDVAALRLFNETPTEELKSMLKASYGFKKIDQTESPEGGVITDFENEMFDRITKFDYTQSSKNRIEYSTVNKDFVNEMIAELKKEKYTATFHKTKKGENYTDYKKSIKITTGKLDTLFISIMYPAACKPNEPITIIVFK